ncbi:hypothetical protein C665_02038 [Thauera aminoaromatica S2]|uniref:Lipoprotein n=2 Tax=Thauera aminoaromatica TaxID=164330 RepID=N6Z8X9_THASP|nr:hypothetical protein C665_02038 [Thauera aminoaromatica S2]
MRRRFLIRLAVAALGTHLMAACRVTPPAAPPTPLTESQARYLESRQRMLQRFGRPGFELVVDAVAGQEFLGVEFFPEYAKHSFYRAGGQTLRSQAKMILSQPVPERARILWRDSDKFAPDGRAVYAGNILGDETIEVGSRIPQEIIDDLERDPRGNLRLKFRMSKDGTLFGWDIQRRPGYDPNLRDPQGRDIHFPAVHSFAGGDFREAEIVNGKVVHKGWYIERRTGRKVETDY